MTEWHVPEELLERFLRVESSREESRRVVLHLLSGCPQCSERAYRLAGEFGLFSRRTGGEPRYDEVFARVLAFASEQEQRMAVEKLRGWAQWAELEPMNPQLRLVTVQSDPRFHNFGLYTRLLEASRWYSRTEPAEAVDIVRLAVLVAERLDRETIGEGRAADLEAAAWAALGNTQRMADDFEGTRRSLNEAWRILEQRGTHDPMERASLISLEGSYMKDIGEFEAAESMLEQALDLYHKVGDTHQQGRILLQMGEIIGHVQPQRGIAHIQKSLTLLDASREPRLDLCARHALARFLNDTGRSEEALGVLERARPLYNQFQDEMTQLRLHWLEGRIAHRLGDLTEAENIFVQLWEEFRARNLNQEVVLVTIELAQVLTRKGEAERAAQLAAESYSIMRDWGLHKDALAAWLVFQDALSHRQAIGDLFQRLGEYYRRHWFTPARFEPKP